MNSITPLLLPPAAPGIAPNVPMNFHDTWPKSTVALLAQIPWLVPPMATLAISSGWPGLRAFHSFSLATAPCATAGVAPLFIARKFTAGRA